MVQDAMFRTIRPDTVWEMMGIVLSVIVIAVVMTLMLLLQSYKMHSLLRYRASGNISTTSSNSSRAAPSGS